MEGERALVKKNGKEVPLNSGDFALARSDEKHRYPNKGEKPLK